MPSHDIHKMVDRIVLGREYEHVHKWMDEPVKWLGVKHRMCRHNPLILLMRFGISDDFVAAMLHLYTDWGISELNRGRRAGICGRKRGGANVRNRVRRGSFRKRR